MSHVHDLDSLEITISWQNADGVVDDQYGYVEDGEWHLGINVGERCCLEVPVAAILALLAEAQSDMTHRFAEHTPDAPVKFGGCCWEDPPEVPNATS